MLDQEQAATVGMLSRLLTAAGRWVVAVPSHLVALVNANAGRSLALSRLLVAKGVVTETELKEALAQARADLEIAACGGPIVRALRKHAEAFAPDLLATLDQPGPPPEIRA